jgi:hypothetical protein|tara:strand:+ start:13 stop:165 length:153 start_codon:yes stop_codon:yes gene_type:complete
MKIERNKITMLKSDFEYLMRFEKYIREYESDIYEKAYSWAKDKNNSYYEN